MVWRKDPKKRGLHGVNKHFESLFNAAWVTSGLIQRFPKSFLVCMYQCPPVNGTNRTGMTCRVVS